MRKDVGLGSLWMTQRHYRNIMKIIFAGTPEISAVSLRMISQSHEVLFAITRPDALVGRNRVLTPSPVARQAQELGIPVVKANAIEASLAEKISSSGAEKAVVIAYGAMIPEPALNAIDWWNIHYSLLPMWRGASPLQHSMMADSASGISIFKLDKGMDTGPIIAQQEIQFEPEETGGEALNRFTIIASRMVSDLLARPNKEVAQAGTSSHARKLTRADAKIDWNRTAYEIHRLVRAMNPEPIAWTQSSGKDVKVIRTRMPEGPTDYAREPGAVFRNPKGVTLVQCGGETVLELIELQPAGKSKMLAPDWLNGQNKEVFFG